MSAEPILKWVGGKRQLLPELIEHLPEKYNRYFEPFIGGGALFFYLSPKDAVINDYNSDLINLYNVVKNNPIELMKDVLKHENTEEYFYKLRNIDRNKEAYAKLTSVNLASRMLFLNKTGFNGLFRVNAKNEYNVPYGRYKNPTMFNENNLMQCSEVLKRTTILNGDFSQIKSMIKKGDLVYLDPPYVPLSDTSSFTSYTDVGFGFLQHEALKELCDYIHSIGAYFIQSNSDTLYVNDTYKKYNIYKVDVKRNISAKIKNRGTISELIIKNF